MGRPRTRPGRRWPTRRTPPPPTAPTCAAAASGGHPGEGGPEEDTAAPAGRSGGRPPAFDPGRYKERNTVERCFAKLKQFRAVATRYDKREFMYQGTVDVASIRIWLRDPVP